MAQTNRLETGTSLDNENVSKDTYSEYSGFFKVVEAFRGAEFNCAEGKKRPKTL
jgi:hypothetical protein